MNPTKSKLARLRREMRREGLAAYYVPSVDPHQSEYVPECWQRRRWLSGFSGSKGDIVVTLRRAALWTDGRYHLQASRELAGSGIELMRQGRPGVPTLPRWLATTLRQGEVLGADGRLVSRRIARELERAAKTAGARLALPPRHLVDRIWGERPPRPRTTIVHHPPHFSGETARSKLQRLRAAMQEQRADAHVITAPDAIAWLFNLRATDIPFNPVPITYAVITHEGALLFCDGERLQAAARRALDGLVQTAPYAAFDRYLGELGRANRRLWVDGTTVTIRVLAQLRRATLITSPSPITAMKARKNRTELAGAQRAHLRDGIALVRFLSWLSRTVARRGLTELDVADRLLQLRAEGEHFRGESFAPIVGYGPHGAIIHYCATRRSNARLRPGGILLLDSGGQYLDGTTDVTRTVLLGGRASAELKQPFTRVVQGHIALASCRFPAGTAGRQLDVLARLPLWQVGLDYAHGTGHGVGAYLSVHEGPQSIGTRGSSAPLEPGNILSIEPGYYLPGAHGIRIENLAIVGNEPRRGRASTFLRFELLTLCPIDRRLVDPKLLSPDEQAWLDAYHRHVWNQLEGHLEQLDRRWLKTATAPLRR